MRAEDDAAEGCDGGFANIELLFDEKRAQHEQAREATEDHVSQMWPIEIKVIPCHGEIETVAVSARMPVAGDRVVVVLRLSARVFFTPNHSTFNYQLDFRLERR